MLNQICKGFRPLQSTIAVQARQLNANRCAVTKIKRSRYTRQYPTSAVLPDGSTITIKYPAPVQLIRFPIEMEKASEEEKRKVPIATFNPPKNRHLRYHILVHLLRRPKQTLVVQEDSGDSFDPMKYVKM